MVKADIQIYYLSLDHATKNLFLHYWCKSIGSMLDSNLREVKQTCGGGTFSVAAVVNRT